MLTRSFLRACVYCIICLFGRPFGRPVYALFGWREIHLDRGISLSVSSICYIRSKAYLISASPKTYTDPRSFTPISLSNDLQKALEKLCMWETDEILETNPLSIQQHGFQQGKCTESTISKTVNFIEQNLDKGKQCLAVFLDIKGAFDTICLYWCVTSKWTRVCKI